MLKIVQIDKKLKFVFKLGRKERDFISQKNVCNLKKNDSFILSILKINKQQYTNSKTVLTILFSSFFLYNLLLQFLKKFFFAIVY